MFIPIVIIKNIKSSQAWGSAFTLVELLSAVAILAVLTTALVFFVGSYITWSQNVADQRTLLVLNDALTRYKCEGGNVNALTVGANIGGVLAQLQTPTTWGDATTGFSHQFLQAGVTYPARSLLAVGNQQQYHFTQYNSYTGETPAAGTPTSQYPYGQGVGYMDSGGAGYPIDQGTTSSTGWIVFRDTGGTYYYFRATGSASNITIPATTPVTFWSCVANGNPTPSGTICYFILTNNTTVVSLDVSGITTLTWIGLINCTHLTTLRAKNCNQLTTINCSNNYVLATLDISGCSSLQSLEFAGCGSLRGTTASQNAIYSSLPTFSSGAHTIHWDGIAVANPAGDAAAAAKGWTVTRSG
jgi:type II secretory pathway pseudopilin PulG